MNRIVHPIMLAVDLLFSSFAAIYCNEIFFLKPLGPKTQRKKRFLCNITIPITKANATPNIIANCCFPDFLSFSAIYCNVIFFS